MAKLYLTTSIAYVNGAPHVGYALELAQADAIARWRRAQGEKVFFLTGTDEHGAKIARAAEAAGKTPREFVDENAKKFEALKIILNCSWDDFIRTSDEKRHWPNVIDVWKKLEAVGDIYKKTYRGFYCVGHEAFVTEKDLVDGKCRDHMSAPEVVEEENYFFRLSKYADRVRALIVSGEIKIIPEGRATEIINFIDQGMEDISFSRPRKDLSWGVPVPGDDTQTIYVWCDALVNYLYPKEWWPADVHMIGKDILRFHALYWPAMLLSAGMDLPKTIFVHGHITVDGQKMSKTVGNVVDPVLLVEKYGVDPVRYYLLREIPPTDDGDFSYTKFEERYNADLANGLGNFVARVLALTERFNTGISDISNSDAKNRISDVQKLVNEKMNDYKFHEALAAIWELISYGDRLINEKETWKSGDGLGEAVQIVGAVGDMLPPFLPATAEKIKEALAQKKKINLFPKIK